MDLNVLGTVTSIISLILAILFWYLASKQASKADMALSEIKDKMMSWQNDMNKAAINLIEAKPEVIAQKIALEGAKNNSEFMDRLAGIVEKLSNEMDEKSSEYKIGIIKELLNHQKSSIVEKEKLKTDIIASRQTKQPEPR
jgi:hypothetical protein